MQFHYIVDFEVTALAVLLVITVRFYTLRRFPDILTRLFGFILWIAILDLSLDIVGAHTIEFAHNYPAWINQIINTAFYSVQTIFPVLLMTYVLWSANKQFSRSRTLRLFLVPAILTLALILSNHFTHLVFYLDNSLGFLVYTRGPWFNTLYISTCFYFTVSVILLLRYRLEMRKEIFWSIIGFIAFNAVALILQILFPDALLTGVGITIAILMLFFTIENPESMVDVMTGVFNYTALLTFLSDRISEKGRIFLVGLDVRGIRKVNNTYGIWTGDEAMREVGLFLTGLEGKHVWAFRTFGTRFLLIADTEEQYQNTIADISHRFQNTWRTSRGQVSLRATVRYLDSQDFFNSPEDVINLIDLTYSALSNDDIGTIEHINGDILRKAMRYELVDNALRKALSEGEKNFTINFQPIYNIQEKKFTSCEVLLRFKDEQLGVVSPDEFIVVAEKTGLIQDIDKMVIRRACQFLYRHPEIESYGVDCIEINLSAADFFTDICDDVRSIVTSCGAKPEMLCFEVTETAATKHPENLTRFMTSMARSSYKFALDDFGTGFTNLAQVADFPFNIIKLDKTLLNSEKSAVQVMFDELVRMFSKMNLLTVTEGVETEEQANRVISLESDYIQGFYYSRPLPEDEFIEFIKKNNR